jgi:hypothetical protein
MDDATQEVPELKGAFETFAALRESPAEIAPARVGSACRAVAAWAEERSLITVAAHFAEAAAYADPEGLECANDAGRLCRRAALNERAALWFDRAFYAARRLKRRREMIRALLGYGSLAKNVGRMDAALDAYERAARLARRTRRRKQAAEAYHDLLAITAEIGPFEHAEMHALTAAQRGRPGCPGDRARGLRGRGTLVAAARAVRLGDRLHVRSCAPAWPRDALVHPGVSRGGMDGRQGSAGAMSSGHGRPHREPVRRPGFQSTGTARRASVGRGITGGGDSRGVPPGAGAPAGIVPPAARGGMTRLETVEPNSRFPQ